jgi:Bacterial membrane protein YfhO
VSAPGGPIEASWRSALRRPALVPLLFLLVAVALFHETVLGGRQFFYRDLALQWHPQAEAFVHSIASGSWPLWNPFVSFGHPLLANPNNEVLYPFTWLNLLMSAWTFYTWYVVFHFVLAGVGTCVLGRHLGLSRPAAVVAGLLFVLSGPFLSLVNLWAHMAAVAWMPWIVWAGDRALLRPGIRPALAWGASFAATILCGSPEMGAMAAVVAATLTLRHVPVWRREPRRAGAALWCALLALAFALALSAGQWLPSLDLARHSMRAQMPASAREFWSLHPLNLLQLVLPVFPDRLPIHGVFRAQWYESREPYLVSLYLGLPASALCLAGLANGRARRWVWALGGLSLLALLVALGRHAPVYEALVTLVPPLRSLRFPAKAVVLAAFGLALVAGHGFDAWRERRGGDVAWTTLALILALAAAAALGGGALVATGAAEWGSALLLRGRRSYAEILAPVSAALFACGALAAVAAVAALLNRLVGRTRGPVLACVVASAALLDLAVAQRGLNPTAPRTALAGVPPVLSFARPAPHQRLFVFDYTRDGTGPRFLRHDRAFVTALREEDWDPWHGALALHDYAYPSFLALWGIEGSFGIDAVKLLSSDVTTVNTLVERYDESPALTHRLLRLGAVDTVVALHRTGFEELTQVATVPSLLLEPSLVFRVPDALPRAFVVGRARVAPVGQGWRALVAPDFDPAREVVLPEGPVLDSPATGTARIVERRPDRIEIEAELDGPGYVVLVDAYDPGWQATIDGGATRLLRANVAFRAVEVPAGAHRIRFVYRPLSVEVGLAVSAFAALAAVVVSLAGLRRTRAGADA